MSKLAVILIRGRIGIRAEVLTAIDNLRLKRKNTCSIVDDNPSMRGTVLKAKDFITWGEVTPQTLQLLEEKRKGTQENIYHLNPPKGGFERKGIKQPFTVGGALGNRKDRINDLIAKML